MKTMFELNQVIYFIESETKDIEENCKLCEGTGELELKNGKKLNCPKCKKGKIYKLKTEYYVCKFCIEGIAINKEYEDNYEYIKIAYYADMDRQFPYYDYIEKDGKIYAYGSDKEVKVFFTEKEAQKECDRKNEKE